ncbi:tetratricopeptide repeat protein [Butyrivibrio sp. DSM 10294]|uniref:tetratricopeptide repeat protein n=1 Tax=Butyrivibrio sp. DSM 10294 TaxID=2972457 RepID=UPI00234E5327|nr:tetratricopeptide repeat protein [Butyrivibrio sp. DSM 10294]MDC7293249.1 tetratricopeptide repeat protein [Butyrivibrio sp. DSM 10294]
MSNVIRVNGQAKGGSRFHKIIVAILSAILIDFVGTFGLLSLSTKLRMFNYAFFVTVFFEIFVAVMAYAYYFKIREGGFDGKKASAGFNFKDFAMTILVGVVGIFFLYASLHQFDRMNSIKAKEAHLAYKALSYFKSYEERALDALNETISYDRDNTKLIRERAGFQVIYGEKLKDEDNEAASRLFDFAIEDYRRVASAYADDPEYYYERGTAYRLAGASRTDEALADFLTAIEKYNGEDEEIENKYRFGYIRTCKEHAVDDKDVLYASYCMFHEMVDGDDKEDIKKDITNYAGAEWYSDMAEICQKIDSSEAEILDLYDKAIIENPYDATLYIGRAGFREPTDDNLQAIVDDYTKAIECTPDNLEYYYLRGWAYYEVGGDANYEKALADFNEVIKRDSKHYSSLAGMAYVHANMKDYDEAISYINRAISVKGYASYYEARGRMYYYKGDYDQAIADYEKSISLDGRADLCRKLIISAYYRRDDNYDKVRELAEKEIAEHPDNPYLSSFYCIYGHTYYDEGQYDKALEKYRAAYNVGKSKDIGDESLAFYLGNCGDVYSAIENYELAEKEYTSAQNKLDKTSLDWGKYGYQRACAMFYQKKYDSVMSCLEEITNNTSDSALLQDCYKLIGHSYYSKAEYNDAIREYELSEKQTTDPVEKADCFYWMAYAYHNMGEKDAAADCAYKAVTLDPTNEEYKKFLDEVNQA